MTHTPAPRTSTPIDAVADAHLETMAAIDPVTATMGGVTGHDHELTDYSPDGWHARADAARATLDAVDRLDPVDDVDRITVAALRDRLGVEVELIDSGEDLSMLNVLASPVQLVRDVFDLMPTDTDDDWARITVRLAGVPAALAGLTESLRAGAARGQVSAVRQVIACADQADDLAGSRSTLLGLAATANATHRGAAEAAARAAQVAYGELATFLRTELAPVAPSDDAVGADRYALWSRHFLGAEIDQTETYAWGLDELARITAEQTELAARIAGPGSTVADAIATLDADPARLIEGTDALQAWMQELSDAAIRALDGRHFTIGGPVRRLECCIAPSQTGGIYYSGPSEDFSRPGRMWWSVPAELTTFTTWRETTTVYHEGVPGHHLQIAGTTLRANSLNRWRRLGCWVSGHGEGWALYAERLMADLGFLEDPGDRFGMLDAQRLRAARVVVDIGVHLGLPCPDRWGGGRWDADKAWAFLVDNVAMEQPMLRFELDRYLGWPAQAPSYKVGQRLWEAARDEALARDGASERTLTAFHDRALALGSLGLDVMRDALR